MRVYHQRLAGQCSPSDVPPLPVLTEAVWRELSHVGRRWEKRDPALMDAGTLGDESNESHIWNSNQNARQGRGSNTRRVACVAINLRKLHQCTHTHTHMQFTPLRNHYSSVETDSAITWKARKTSLQRVLASLPLKAMHVLCVRAVVHACLHSWGWGCASTSWFRP